MAKKKNNKRKRNHHHKDPPSTESIKKVFPSTEEHDRTTTTTNIRNTNLKSSSVALPLPFPSGVPFPKDAFLRNIEPYKKSFQTALDTCYEGFAIDLTVPAITESKIQNALNDLVQHGFFRTDVTQPFGLGTRCAKTYVTRCLLGDFGTTYKYLGLRMFSHPWDRPTRDVDDDDSQAVQVIGSLNQTLTTRTEHHLAILERTRRQRGADENTVIGRAGFDICLVNRMTHTADLKPEPSIGDGRCAVSWHADSSLEHYSTIAVYQTIVNANNTKHKKHKNNNSQANGTNNNDWSVALRVTHHAEGPEASRRGTDIQSTLVADTPAISVSLPSGSAYYLLDDFNHHHQHAVLSNGSVSSDNIRYSCTHRLLRTSHNVNFILERCQKACSLFHKKGSKLWRSEQLLLTEIESEWIRQFYIQGQQHKDLLWKHWGDPICRLLRYWSQLEKRTEQTIHLLQLAAEARCGLDASAGQPSSKKERKSREKRKKALETVEELLSRAGTAQTAAVQSLYEPLADLLRERAEMRRLWKEREEDLVFRDMDPCLRPLPVPFEYCTDKKNDDEVVSSPLPENLIGIGDSLVAFAKAFVSGDVRSLPEVGIQNQISATSTDGKDKNAKTPADAHSQPLDWEGWTSGRKFGLEMQDPWAKLLLQNKKTIETRAYSLPPALIGKRIEVLQSQEGRTVSSLDNVVQMTDNKAPNVTRVGWCLFTKCIRYTDADHFEADADAHCVTKEHIFYPFQQGEESVIYGWVVGNVGSYSDCSPDNTLRAIVRRHRSLFELQLDDSSSKSESNPLGKKKKKRRY